MKHQRILASLGGISLALLLVLGLFAMRPSQGASAAQTQSTEQPDSATVNVLDPPTYPFCESFEAGTLPAYMFTETTSSGSANGRVQVTNAYPHTGVYGLDLDTDCNNCGGATQQAAIMSVDLAGQSGVTLEFWVFEHFDENNPEDGVFVSDDGGTTWALIQSLNNFPASYQQVQIDLDAAISGVGMSYVDGFMIKFQSLDGATIPGNDGYSFDDICLQPLEPNITVNPDSVESTQHANEVMTSTLTIGNVGSLELNWDIEEAPGACTSPTDVPWVSTSPVTGTTPALGSSNVNVVFDSTGLTPNVYTGNLCINSDDTDTPQITVPVTLTVEGAPLVVITPESLAPTLGEGQTLTQTLTISNVGDADLDWSIYEAAQNLNSVGAPTTSISFGPASQAETANGVTSATSPDTIVGNGPTITASFTTAAPTIDGNISAPEWAEAFTMDITLGGAPVIMYVMHDSTTLYLAFDDQLDTALSAFDQIGIYFDDEGGTSPLLYDNGWLNGGCGAINTGEGNFWLGNFTPDPDDQWREWFTGPAACAVQYGGTNTLIAYSAATGHLQYETAIPLDGSSALVAQDGDTFGLRVYTADSGANFTGRWPEPSTFNVPSTYGNLYLAPSEPSACDLPQDIPWASVSPITGTTAGGSSSPVSVSFDSTGMSVGVYTGTLCINSNDPVTPLVTVPLTLTVAPFSYGIDLSGDQSASVAPGTSVTYVLSVTNTGNTTDTVDLSATGVWTTTLSDTSLLLGAGATMTFTVDVLIPASANESDMETTIVTATSQNDGAATDSTTLTTTALLPPPPDSFDLYLPLAYKP